MSVLGPHLPVLLVLLATLNLLALLAWFAANGRIVLATRRPSNQEAPAVAEEASPADSGVATVSAEEQRLQQDLIRFRERAREMAGSAG